MRSSTPWSDLAREFQGKLNVYKVNADEKVEVASVFGIQSLPSLLFISMDEAPRRTVGALPRAGIMKLVREVLKVE